MSVPWVLSQTLGGSLRNDFNGYVGCRFNTGSNTPTVTHLGRWKVSGNSAVHNLYLFKFVDGTSNDVQIATVSVDLSTGAAGTYIYGTLGSPVTLLTNTQYYVYSQEVNGGDQWYNNGLTTLDSFTANIGTLTARSSGYSSTIPGFNDAGFNDSPDSFGPPNFQVSTAVSPSVLWLYS